MRHTWWWPHIRPIIGVVVRGVAAHTQLFLCWYNCLCYWRAANAVRAKKFTIRQRANANAAQSRRRCRHLCVIFLIFINSSYTHICTYLYVYTTIYPCTLLNTIKYRTYARGAAARIAVPPRREAHDEVIERRSLYYFYLNIFYTHIYTSHQCIGIYINISVLLAGDVDNSNFLIFSAICVHTLARGCSSHRCCEQNIFFYRIGRVTL